MTATLDAWLKSQPDRYSCCGGHIRTQGHAAFCTPVAPVTDKDVAYARFKLVLVEAVRSDGTIHACDVRPRTRGRFEPRLLSSCWKRARHERLLVEVGHERSDDEQGKNAGRWEPYYELKSDRLVVAAERAA